MKREFEEIVVTFKSMINPLKELVVSDVLQIKTTKLILKNKDRIYINNN